MSISLAIKYRPTTWDDVSEQSSTKLILQQQLATNTFKHAYLFCGPAGCGKTTCARIFANDINKNMGNPIELDAASNNGVDDVRDIIQQAKTKSLDSAYKIFIIDECHALSNSAWQAMLKIIEEPPAGSIFIFCTTDPQKIPKTIISRVQRYDFQRISQNGIVNRLNHVLSKEGLRVVSSQDAIEYIAKLADGGMRDAITMLDKCLSYSTDLTIENVLKALDVVNYDLMFELTGNIINGESKKVIATIENMYNSGKDLKQFVKSYIQFLTDVIKFGVGCDWQYLQVPKSEMYEIHMKNLTCDDEFFMCRDLLNMMIRLNSDIKYSATVKYDIEAALLVEVKNR